jgi:exosortase K
VSLAARGNGPAFAVSLALAAGAKAAYPRLGPDDLRFLTAPIQALVGLATGIDFAWESGYGYVSLADRLVIAKSCTGVNFLLAAFGLLAFTVIPAVAGARRKLLAVPALAVCAYGATVTVNAVRIALGVSLHDGGVAWGWLDAARVHRLAGILVYLAALVGVHAAARLSLRHASGAGPILAAPLAAYGVIAIAVPLANGALAANPRLFAEHCAWIALVAMLGWAVVLVPERVRTATRQDYRSFEQSNDADT